MHRRNTLLASFVSIGLTVGCTWSPEANINGGGPGGNTGGGNHPGGPGGNGIMVDAGGPTGEVNCGVTTLGTTRLPPDLLLVYDKSGSMAEDPATGNACNPAATCPSKWNQAKTAINTALMNSTMVNFGLKLFSDTGNCAVAAGAQVNIGANTAAAITNALNRTGPAGNTPTTLAVQRGGDYLASLTDQNPKFMVLVTDGAPTCGGQNGNGADDANAIAMVTTQLNRGFGTFVVGLATSNDAQATMTLTSMSANGGHPRAGTPNYYLANNTDELVAALATITGQVRSCTFALSGAPPDPANVKVQADGVTVPASATDGWGYNPSMTSVILTGTYCSRVLDGTIMNVTVLFGCGITGIP
jgi:hypothetical protein